MNFAKYVGTPFLQKTTVRLVPIITVSIVVKGKLENETVNYDINLKHKNLGQNISYQKGQFRQKNNFNSSF